MSQIAVNTIRILAADIVEKAESGHPGLPMGMADCAYVLWTKFLKFNPNDPEWEGRDRFVLSAGHGSALLYIMLHLSGYDMSMEDLKQFRQWQSRTPGHPENYLPGVETTTGPLGQGVGNAVGMALAAKKMAADFPEFGKADLPSQTIYTICGDGDLMEGVSSEAASLAGHLKLDNLICIYDSNRITIDGSTDISFSENVGQRFAAYGWNVQEIDGHDRDEIQSAIENAKKDTTAPSLIIARTHIGFGSPNKQDSKAAHGAPLGKDEIRLMKKNLGFDSDQSFHVPDSVRRIFQKRKDDLFAEYKDWLQRRDKWKKTHSEEYERYCMMMGSDLPKDLGKSLDSAISGKIDSTRNHSGRMIQVLAEKIPGLVGGSADLAASCKTAIKGGGIFSADNRSGKNIYYGIREFAMGSVMNGIALYGGMIPFGGTFLVFSDYMRSAIRMASLMKIQVIYVFTHDSLFVGEDGPTHQPVEQVPSLEMIPDLTVIRPADEDETVAAWQLAVENRQGPTALILTRQKLPVLKREIGLTKEKMARGAYILQKESGNKMDALIISTGSEVGISFEAVQKLNEEGLSVRLVSMPSRTLFMSQDADYKKTIISEDGTPTVVVQAARSCGWGDLIRNPYTAISMNQFGKSAPYQLLEEKFGFTAETVYRTVKDWIEKA